jgi:hypothetical protein
MAALSKVKELRLVIGADRNADPRKSFVSIKPSETFCTKLIA